MTTHPATNNRFESAFEAHAFEALLADILNVQRDLPHRAAIYGAAQAVDLPPSILAAIVLIETNRRPWYIAALENVFTLFNLWLFGWLGLPLLNVSVGPGQLKLSTAVLIQGIPLKAAGKTVTTRQSLDPAERRRFARKLIPVVNPQANIKLAGAYIRLLLQLYCQQHRSPCNWQTALSDPFLIYLARHYNGIDPHAQKGILRFFHYDLVLRALTHRLSKLDSL